MNRTRNISLGFLAVLAGALISCGCSGCGGGRSGDNVKLSGQGATFPDLIYQQWFKDFSKKQRNIRVEYQGVGSGAGESKFLEGTVDFAASDAPSVDKLAESKRGVVFLPMTAGSVVVAYNPKTLEGVKELKLSREALAGIFLGTVETWDDQLIKDANPGADLPNTPIRVVVRGDKSGTTAVFKNHLAAISPEFAKTVGTGKEANFPVPKDRMIKPEGNPGIANAVKDTEGAIGYLEVTYAKSNNLPTAALQNKSGEFVQATAESGEAALGSIELPENLVGADGNPAGKGAYPIVSYTWLLAYETYPEEKTMKAVKELVNFCLADEQQQAAAKLDYIPLPAEVAGKVKEALDRLKVEKK